MEPEPPPITIVDPHLPGGPDLLASGPEREPWRSTPRQRRIAAVVVAVLVVVAAATGVVGHVRAGRSADRQALTSLRLAADVAAAGLEQPGTVLLSIRNDGPRQVRLLSVRLLAPGYPEQPLRDVLGPSETALLQLLDSAACGPSLLSSPAEVMRLRLRTHRGQVATRDVTLGPGAFRVVNHAARERCGYLPADEAFGFGVQSVERRGKQVVIRALVYDASLLPLVLMRVAPAPGLTVEVSPRLPLRLPVQTTPRRTTHFVDLTLRIRVSDCPTFVSSPGFAMGEVDRLVRAWVVRDASIFEVPIALVEPEVSEVPPVTDALMGLLAKSCAGVMVRSVPPLS